MKNKNVLQTVLTFCCSLLLATSAFANNATETEAATATSAKISEVVEIEKAPGVSVNALIGLSSFEKTGRNSQSNDSESMAGGITFDIGDTNRVIETGLSYYSANTKSNSTEVESGYLAIPMNAKFYTNGTQNGFFVKAGALTSFLVSSTNRNATRSLDIMGNIGFGGKIPVQKNFDFIIEGTYNHGFLDQLKSAGDTFNTGYIVIGGLSFRL